MVLALAAADWVDVDDAVDDMEGVVEGDVPVVAVEVVDGDFVIEGVRVLVPEEVPVLVPVPVTDDVPVLVPVLVDVGVGGGVDVADGMLEQHLVTGL